MKSKYIFQISTSSGVPIYRQIIDQVKTQIATGRLEAGIFMPSVRQVAEELEINPMTVSKAYSLLEKEGVLEFVRGQGMMVGESSISKKNLQKREDSIVPLLKEVVTKAQQLSLEKEKVIKTFESVWKEQKNG
ncbi:MAG: GntR family transcriptional regulator [Candidatus Omnitrophica bacterium]|nr:GntR family transcriptional regulator [Candidatus Omnitrophota bacterium]